MRMPDAGSHSVYANNLPSIIAYRRGRTLRSKVLKNTDSEHTVTVRLKRAAKVI